MPREPMSTAAIEAVVKGIAPVLREYVKQSLAELDARFTTQFAALDERIKAIPAPIEGPQGKTGEAGKEGASGKDGSDGEAGRTGDRGLDGNRGLDGRDGRDGKDGIASRDEIKALVSAEMEKGLEVLLVTLTKRAAEIVAALPIVIYKGVYAPGKTYAPGNMVTWGGDMYHCKAETAEKPGASNLWEIAVRKGRDGREASRMQPRVPA